MAERRNAVICNGMAATGAEKGCKGKATQSEAVEAHRFERHRLATAQQREDILLKGETSMKKVIVGVASVLASALLMAGCNKQVIDLTYEYNWAQLKMPDGTIVEGAVESWRDYEGDQLQVVIDGVTYLVHSSNVVLRH